MSRRVAALVLICTVATGVTACGAVTPTPSHTPPPDRPVPSSAATAFPEPTADATPRTQPLGDLGQQLEMHALDLAWTSPLLEFISDGTSIVYSSGAADGPDGDTAPDVWRYTPGETSPQLVWSNPQRARQIIRIAGDAGTLSWVDMDALGRPDWNLWLLPRDRTEPVLLDAHPGDDAVSSLVPSIAVSEDIVAWTAFDEGAEGAVSQLLVARAPSWQPQLFLERDVDDAELWLPSILGNALAFTEVRYAADHATDERFVYLADPTDPSSLRRLDDSGRATMPLVLPGGDVVWKETDPGFNMFNWGKLVRWNHESGTTEPLTTRWQEYVNYPSVGERFLAAWGSDSLTFAVYDAELAVWRLVDRYPLEQHVAVPRVHVGGPLMAWVVINTRESDLTPPQLYWAYLPGAGMSTKPPP